MQFTATDIDYSKPVGLFTADIKIDSNIEFPTVIHAAQTLSADQQACLWYEHGFDVTFEGVDTDIKPVVQENTNGNEYSFKVVNAEFNEKVVRVTISPKPDSAIIQ